MMAARGWFLSSDQLKSRPATNGIPRVRKNPGETMMSAAATASAGFVAEILETVSFQAKAFARIGIV